MNRVQVSKKSQHHIVIDPLFWNEYFYKRGYRDPINRYNNYEHRILYFTGVDDMKSTVESTYAM